MCHARQQLEDELVRVGGKGIAPFIGIGLAALNVSLEAAMQEEMLKSR